MSCRAAIDEVLDGFPPVSYQSAKLEVSLLLDKHNCNTYNLAN